MQCNVYVVFHYCAFVTWIHFNIINKISHAFDNLISGKNLFLKLKLSILEKRWIMGPKSEKNTSDGSDGKDSYRNFTIVFLQNYCRREYWMCIGNLMCLFWILISWLLSILLCELLMAVLCIWQTPVTTWLILLQW